jgi:hypothetical protein
MSIHRARTAVTPWRAYPPSAAPLRPGVLPRITSAITDTIQAAENSHTTTVPIHHHMVASPPFQDHTEIAFSGQFTHARSPHH